MLIGITQLLDISWQGYKKQWRHFLPYLIILILTGTLAAIAGYIGIKIELHLKADRLINDLIILLIYLISAVIGLWCTLGIIKTAAAIWYNQIPANWKQTMRINARLIIPIIINTIVATVIITVGSILLLIPGIIFFVWYNFTTYAIILDKKNWHNAFAYSKSLVIGRWWSIAWRLTAILILYSVISYVIQWPLILLGNYLLRDFSVLTIGIVTTNLSSLVNIILTPLLIGSLVGLYLHASHSELNQPHTILPTTEV